MEEDRRWHLTNHDPLTAPIRSFAQIARITGITKESAQEAHDRALAKIRAALEKDFTDRKRRDEQAELNEG